jgi:serine protease Do
MKNILVHISKAGPPRRLTGAVILAVILAAALAACSPAPVTTTALVTVTTTATSSYTVTPVSSTTSTPAQPTTPVATPTTTPGPVSGNPTDFVAAVQQVMPSIMQIEVTFGPQGAPGDPRAQGGAGTGWVFRSDGIIVTNNHVVDSAKTITVIMPDGTKQTAAAVQANASKDLAVVRINSQNLPVAVTGDSSTLNLAQPVAAIGNALNLGIRVTVGVVSQLDVPANYNNISLTGLIETDAAINPGNSGGVLINNVGEVVGIPNAGLDDPTLDVENYSYAISINEAMPVIQNLISQLP